MPGLLAQSIDPDIVPEMARRLGHGSVLVTGTNGKTTTARLLASILRSAGLSPVANRAGSNMMRGVAAALTEGCRWSGGFADEGRCIGVFEVDEATLPLVAAAVQPRAIVFTNLFRDQLDRYGEVEHVAGLWLEAAKGLPPATTLVLNADDPSVANLGCVARGYVVHYGLDDAAQAVEGVEHAADARWCSTCGEELTYEAIFYGHVGHWRCLGCGRMRPSLDISGRRVVVNDNGLGMEMELRGTEFEVYLPLWGLYNAYNALAAAAAAMALGIGPQEIRVGLAAATAAFGRQEKLEIDGKEVRVVLAKNPAGLNQVLRAMTAAEGSLDVAFFLNDGIADGRDISWIWDVDFEVLAGRVRELTISGTRAWDMALRLKYAGLDPWGRVEMDAGRALERAIARTRRGSTLYVVPTYTAMLKVRGLLARRAGRGGFWEDV